MAPRQTMPLNSLQPRCYWSVGDLSAQDTLALLAGAKALQQALGGARPLAGRHVAVLSDALHGVSASIFAAAAAALGAVVVHIRPLAAHLDEQQAAAELARTLGRLYAAVECDGLDEPAMQQLANAAGVPVFNAVAGDIHPSRLLADLLTMRDHAQRPLAEMSLHVAVDARSPLALCWRQVGRLTGVRVLAGAPGPGAPAPTADFICEPARSSDRAEAPDLLAVDHASGRPQSLRKRQTENHGYMVQAMLSSSIN